MVQECSKKYDKDNPVFLACLQTGILERIGACLDVLPVWRRETQEVYQLDVILYGVDIRKEQWLPPQGIIRDAAGSAQLVWLSEASNRDVLSGDSIETEMANWQPFPHMDDAWWDARERVIGCCEAIGELFRRWNEDSHLSGGEIGFLQSISADYQTLLPTQLFGECRELYPDFFAWLMKWR